MKHSKKLLFVFFFALVAGISLAQVKFGFKAGANGSYLLGVEKVLNSMEGASDISTEVLFGYQAGLSLDLSAGIFFIRPELMYSYQGFAIKSKLAYSGAEAEKIHMNYMKLPLHVGYKRVVNMDSDVRFGIGGYAAYYLSGHEKLKAYEFKKLDYGVSAMFAVDYVNTSTAICYEFGLVDLIGIDGWSTNKQSNKLPDVRNTSLRISVAYYF